MSNTNPSGLLDQFNYTKDGVPKNINVLSILTFIGSGFSILGALLTPVIGPFMNKIFDKATAGNSELSAEQLKKIEDSRALMDLQQANMIPLMIVGILGAALCIAGALMMRKQKMDGFWLYVAGQIIPLVATVFIMGKAMYSTPVSYSGFIIPFAFIFAYYSQRKYLVK